MSDVHKSPKGHDRIFFFGEGEGYYFIKMRLATLDAKWQFFLLILHILTEVVVDHYKVNSLTNGMKCFA